MADDTSNVSFSLREEAIFDLYYALHTEVEEEPVNSLTLRCGRLLHYLSLTIQFFQIIPVLLLSRNTIICTEDKCIWGFLTMPLVYLSRISPITNLIALSLLSFLSLLAILAAYLVIAASRKRRARATYSKLYLHFFIALFCECFALDVLSLILQQYNIDILSMSSSPTSPLSLFHLNTLHIVLIVISSLLLPIYLFFAYTSSLLYNKFELLRLSSREQAHGRLSVLHFYLLLLFSIGYAVSSPAVNSAQRVVTSLLTLLASLSLSLQHSLRTPYMSDSINQIYGGFYASSIILSIICIFDTLLPSFLTVGNRICLIVIFFCVGYSLTLIRKHRISCFLQRDINNITGNVIPEYFQELSAMLFFDSNPEGQSQANTGLVHAPTSPLLSSALPPTVPLLSSSLPAIPPPAEANKQAKLSPPTAITPLSHSSVRPIPLDHTSFPFPPPSPQVSSPSPNTSPAAAKSNIRNRTVTVVEETGAKKEEKTQGVSFEENEEDFMSPSLTLLSLYKESTQYGEILSSLLFETDIELLSRNLTNKWECLSPPQKFVSRIGLYQLYLALLHSPYANPFAHITFASLQLSLFRDPAACQVYSRIALEDSHVGLETKFRYNCLQKKLEKIRNDLTIGVFAKSSQYDRSLFKRHHSQTRSLSSKAYKGMVRMFRLLITDTKMEERGIVILFEQKKDRSHQLSSVLSILRKLDSLMDMITKRFKTSESHALVQNFKRVLFGEEADGEIREEEEDEVHKHDKDENGAIVKKNVISTAEESVIGLLRKLKRGLYLLFVAIAVCLLTTISVSLSYLNVAEGDLSRDVDTASLFSGYCKSCENLFQAVIFANTLEKQKYQYQRQYVEGLTTGIIYGTIVTSADLISFCTTAIFGMHSTMMHNELIGCSIAMEGGGFVRVAINPANGSIAYTLTEQDIPGGMAAVQGSSWYQSTKGYFRQGVSVYEAPLLAIKPEGEDWFERGDNNDLSKQNFYSYVIGLDTRLFIGVLMFDYFSDDIVPSFLQALNSYVASVNGMNQLIEYLIDWSSKEDNMDFNRLLTADKLIHTRRYMPDTTTVYEDVQETLQQVIYESVTFATEISNTLLYDRITSIDTNSHYRYNQFLCTNGDIPKVLEGLSNIEYLHTSSMIDNGTLCLIMALVTCCLIVIIGLIVTIRFVRTKLTEFDNAGDIPVSSAVLLGLSLKDKRSQLSRFKKIQSSFEANGGELSIHKLIERKTDFFDDDEDEKRKDGLGEGKGRKIEFAGVSASPENPVALSSSESKESDKPVVRNDSHPSSSSKGTKKSNTNTETDSSADSLTSSSESEEDNSQSFASFSQHSSSIISGSRAHYNGSAKQARHRGEDRGRERKEERREEERRGERREKDKRLAERNIKRRGRAKKNSKWGQWKTNFYHFCDVVKDQIVNGITVLIQSTITKRMAAMWLVVLACLIAVCVTLIDLISYQSVIIRDLNTVNTLQVTFETLPPLIYDALFHDFAPYRGVTRESVLIFAAEKVEAAANISYEFMNYEADGISTFRRSTAREEYFNGSSCVNPYGACREDYADYQQMQQGFTNGITNWVKTYQDILVKYRNNPLSIHDADEETPTSLYWAIYSFDDLREGIKFVGNTLVDELLELVQGVIKIYPWLYVFVFLLLLFGFLFTTWTINVQVRCVRDAGFTLRLLDLGIIMENQLIQKYFPHSHANLYVNREASQ